MKCVYILLHVYEIDNNEKEYKFDMLIYKNKDVINNKDSKTNYISKNEFDKILLELWHFLINTDKDALEIQRELRNEWE